MAKIHWPWEAVHAMWQISIERLVKEAGFTSLDELYDAWTAEEKKRSRVYLAGPLFSDAERAFNARLTKRLERYFDVYLPQRDGDLLVELIKHMGIEEARQRIYTNDIRALNEADLLIIILDGRSIDEGSAVELGYFYAKGKPCYALQTDPRRLLPTGNHSKIEGALKHRFTSIHALVRWAKRYSAQN